MKTVYGKSLRAVCWGAVASVFLMGSVWAQPVGGDKGGPERGKKPFAELAEKLKLSQDQKTKLDANRDGNRKEADAIREQMTAKQKELSQALDAAVLDMNMVTKIHGELKALIAKKEDQHLAAILEVRKILTPQQFAEFQKIAFERKGPPRDAGGKKAGVKGKKKK